jgi:hypothetical protein
VSVGPRCGRVKGTGKGGRGCRRVALTVGGPGLFGALKLSLVLGMALAVTLACRYRARNPGRHGELCVGVVARTIQLCVVLLTLAVLGNASVAAQLTS